MPASSRRALYGAMASNLAIALVKQESSVSTSEWIPSVSITVLCASLLIGVVLMLEAVLLGFECRGLIIGEAARPRVIAGVRQVLARHPELGAVEAIRTLQLGPEAVMPILHVRQPSGAAGDQLRAASAALVGEIQREVPVIRDVAFATGDPTARAGSREQSRLWARLLVEINESNERGTRSATTDGQACCPCLSHQDFIGERC